MPDLREDVLILNLYRTTLDAIGIACEPIWQTLDRDITFQSGVSCSVNLAHPALAEQRRDFVLCESRADHGTNEIRLRILSKYRHLTHAFDVYGRNGLKMNLSGCKTAMS
jgi:hypothetical protein